MEGFRKLVEDVWRLKNERGMTSFMLASKLKRLKLEIKKWAKEEDGRSDRILNDNLEELRKLEHLEMDGLLREGGRGRRGELKLEIAAKMNLEAISWRQKTRERWIKEVDRNTRYLQSLANSRRKNNYVEELEFGGDTVRGNAVLREKVKDYFTKLYTEEEERRPRQDELPFRQLSAGSKESLEVLFTEEEILDCLRQCNGNKTLRPDGFHMKFLKDFWAVIKNDIMTVFHDFHRAGVFIQFINPTFLVLFQRLLELGT
ncbi:uncharacterized protein LOC110809397 [Carica papaya]|uniref:uncharacterized protein LOC110809397 n=1 Tax=Carica papaya TaxID=3649 RepID=UPI000B8CEAF6|nr:uncharacterized protein LOC110809397 [Carica papaya]